MAAAAAVLEVFFAAFEPSVVFAGAFEAVPDEAGALPAVEAGLGAITIDNQGQRVKHETVVGEEIMASAAQLSPIYRYT